jgi:hypothetical protein
MGLISWLSNVLDEMDKVYTESWTSLTDEQKQYYYFDIHMRSRL